MSAKRFALARNDPMSNVKRLRGAIFPVPLLPNYTLPTSEFPGSALKGFVSVLFLLIPAYSSVRQLGW